MKVIEINASKKERLDQYLTTELELSRNQIQTLIKRGEILVNDKLCKSNYLVKTGDKIKVCLDLEIDKGIKPEAIPLEIIYEDDDLLLINKPAGMVVHPAPGHLTGTVVNALLHYTSNLSNLNGDLRPGIVHRLDKDTSGLLLIAKNNDAHYHLAAQFKNNQIKRQYHALVTGIIPHQKGTIEAPIGRHPKLRQQMTVTDHHAKMAITHFRVLKHLTDITFVECEIETGRTHQIRVHFQYIGYPLLYDQVYGHQKGVKGEGQLLQATKLGFIHPRTQKYLEFSIPLAPAIVKVLSDGAKKKAK